MLRPNASPRITSAPTVSDADLRLEAREELRLAREEHQDGGDQRAEDEHAPLGAVGLLDLVAEPRLAPDLGAALEGGRRSPRLNISRHPLLLPAPSAVCTVNASQTPAEAR